MKTIRIGNDISVSWRVFAKNGAPYVFDNMTSIRPWLISGPYKKQISDFVVSGNVIDFSIDANSIHRLGIYKLVLLLSNSEYDTENTAFDFTEVFQIVSKTYPGPADAVVDGKVSLSLRAVIDSVIVDNTINAPDGEDLTEVDNLLKFRDRTAYQGMMGYKILRKNEGTSFKSQVDAGEGGSPNTIYEVRYEFNLGGETVNLPSGCSLEFNGGLLKNGTLVLDDTSISADYFCFDCDVLGTIKNNEVSSIWFCDDTDDFSEAFTRIVNLSNSAKKPINIAKGEYSVDDSVNGLTITQSVDFNYSKLIANVHNQRFLIMVSNAPHEAVTDQTKIAEIVSAINSTSTYSRKLNSFRNCAIEILSSDNEFQRNHAVNNSLLNPIKMKEYFYVDQEGVIATEFFNTTFDNVSSVTCMSCTESAYFRNLFFELRSDFTGTQTDEYRRLGFAFEYCSNIDIQNVTYDRVPAHGTAAYRYTYEYIILSRCYNVNMENVSSVNTEYTTEGYAPGSAYVLATNSCINLNVKRLNVGGGDTSTWGDLGGNYITNAMFENCTLSRIDVHHRANNLTVRDCKLYEYGIRCTGYGTLLVEGCTFTNCDAVSLREDYGSYWDGDIIINNCILYSNKHIGLVRGKATPGTTGGELNGTSFKFGISAGAIKRLNAYCGRTITVNNIVYYNTSSAMRSFRILITVFDPAAGDGAKGDTDPSDISGTTFPAVYVTGVTTHVMPVGDEYDATQLFRLSYADEYRVTGKTMNIIVDRYYRDYTGAEKSDGGSLVAWAADDLSPAITNTYNMTVSNVNFPLYLRYGNFNYVVDNCTIQRIGSGSYSAKIYRSSISLGSFSPKYGRSGGATGNIDIYYSYLAAGNSTVSSYDIDTATQKLFSKYVGGDDPVYYDNIKVYDSLLNATLANALWAGGSSTASRLYSSDKVVPLEKITSPAIGTMILLEDKPAWWTGTKWVDATGTEV